ncbi:hypothetical protein BJ138DRAFT_1142634 [Hygrophoropsis aurantiaca]|uniref:Uncharacterized protein n=1 Tax=Hygrophoropsis aurantiaca TaxID=72124 RepID=A0ACB8APS4_9AGAM|nr:hypothetical protein BJ138DRAFT_1142634 [Hygrophoropsis aurantiaca]
MKRGKTLTSFSVRRPDEVESYFAQRTLELDHNTRKSVAAKEKYEQPLIEENNWIKAFVADEQHVLQLARATRNAFAAQEKHKKCHVKVLEVMRSIAVGELEEATKLRTAAEMYVGEIRNFVNTGDSGEAVPISSDGEHSSSPSTVSSSPCPSEVSMDLLTPRCHSAADSSG